VGRSNEWDYSGLFEDYTCYEVNEGNDILNNNLPDNEFDSVMCVGMYENLDDPIKMISEVRRILKPNGKVLFGFAGLDYETNGKKYDGRNLEGFKIIKTKDFNREYHFILCQKHY
jgi:ubiquinone/menaquinone biosynthesis C-methylase UbiE